MSQEPLPGASLFCICRSATLLGVVTIQVLYTLGFTSIGIFQTLMVVAGIAMIAGGIMHLQEVKILESTDIK